MSCLNLQRRQELGDRTIDLPQDRRDLLKEYTLVIGVLLVRSDCGVLEISKRSRESIAGAITYVWSSSKGVIES